MYDTLFEKSLAGKQPTALTCRVSIHANARSNVTLIAFTLMMEQRVRLSIYDQLGREIAVLVNEIRTPGTHTVEWNQDGYPKGVYYYRLAAGRELFHGGMSTNFNR